MRLFSSRHSSFFSMLLAFMFSVPLTGSAQNDALSFNGTNTYVDCGNDPLFNTTTSVKAMECWARFSSLSPGYSEIVSKSSLTNGMELLVSNAGIYFYLMKDVNNYYFIHYPASIAILTWYHIVGTWDGVDRNSARLYVNGVAVGGMTGAGDISTGVANVGTLKIGQWSEAGDPRFLPGQVDEVRIWSANRTAAQIKQTMLSNLPSNTPNLIAYYKFNEASGTTAVNSTANSGLDGTIFNGSRVASPVQFAYNAVDFDGLDDYVRVEPNPAYDFSSGTIEFMMKPGVLDVDNRMIVGLRNTAGITRFSIHVSNTRIGMWNNSVVSFINHLFNVGQWYHVAFVCNGVNTTVYVDGSPIGTLGMTYGTSVGMPLHIGMVESAGSERFNGAIDEVRLWNVVRTQSEIQATKDFALQGNEAGLVGLFSFDQGISTGNNTGFTSITDKSSTAGYGRLFNFGLTGSTSNFVSSSIAITLPITLGAFNVTKVNESALISWFTSTESNSSHFNIERSADGSAFTTIGSVNAAGNSNGKLNYSYTDGTPLTGKNFYRLKSVDKDSRSSYSAVRVIDLSALATKLSWTSNDGHNIDITWSGAKAAKYYISDANGRVVDRGILQTGVKRLNTLRPGTYIISTEDKSVSSLRFVVR